MGKYDVTVGQYCEFLNAVAKTDTYGLYNSQWPPVQGSDDQDHPERKFGQLQLLGYGRLQPSRQLPDHLSTGAMQHGFETGYKTASPLPGPGDRADGNRGVHAERCCHRHSVDGDSPQHWDRLLHSIGKQIV